MHMNDEEKYYQLLLNLLIQYKRHSRKLYYLILGYLRNSW